MPESVRKRPFVSIRVPAIVVSLPQRIANWKVREAYLRVELERIQDRCERAIADREAQAENQRHELLGPGTNVIIHGSPLERQLAEIERETEGFRETTVAKRVTRAARSSASWTRAGGHTPSPTSAKEAGNRRFATFSRRSRRSASAAQSGLEPRNPDRVWKPAGALISSQQRATG